MDLGNLGSLVTIRDVAGDGRALIQLAATELLKHRNVQERVRRAVARLDEAEALGAVEPLHDSADVAAGRFRLLEISPIHHRQNKLQESALSAPVTGREGAW